MSGWDRLRYQALWVALLPPLLLYVAWQAIRGGDSRYLKERFGLFRRKGPIDIWLHAASVGEVNAAVPLIRAVTGRYPNLRLLVTTATVSGAQAVARGLPQTTHAYLPLDRPGAARRFLTRFRPRCGLIVETEIWPNLFRAGAEQKIPLAIVNGRLSGRTLHAPAWLRRLYARALGEVTCVLARSDSDRGNYIRLGAPADRCRTVGNIKFAALETARPPEPIDLGRPYLLAASTRDDEEKLLLDAWRFVNAPGHLLVIVPRHPQRLARILRDLAGVNVAVRSRGEPVTGQTQVYLADTFGELGGFIAGADLVFMGGSLVPRGGQNLLEPAAQGKAVVVGPHMENFQAETDLLKEHGAVSQVDSAEALAAELQRLLGDPGARARMAEAARELVAARRDVADRYLAELERCLPEGFGESVSQQPETAADLEG